ncbi:MAG TPA: amino acid adenylation domain-containing protein, partial [Thermoanaerobaculia bacterium]
ATRALLQAVPRACRTRIDEVLAAALLEACSRWTGRWTLQVDLEAHGREEIDDDLDLSRTVGWFTAIYPVTLDGEGAPTPGARLRRVKEQLREAAPRGLGYGVLRYLAGGDAAARLRAAPASQLSFNYLGQLDQAFAADGPCRRSAVPPGAARSPRQRLAYPLQVDAGVVDGELRMVWTFDAAAVATETVERLAADLITALGRIAGGGAVTAAEVWLPADFPLARLDRQELDRTLAWAGERRVDDIYPLSPLQQGLLFHSLDRAESQLYFRQLQCEVTGSLHTAAFARAWQRAVDRHSILRTAFLWRQLERPQQVVLGDAPLAIEERDWRGLASGDQERLLAAFLAEDVRRGFDLESPPPLRIALLRLADERWRLIWSWHHVALDGWSCNLLLREVFALYDSLRRGADDPAGAAEPHPFKSYVAWLEAQDQAAAEAFWRSLLQARQATGTLAVGRAPARHEPGPLQRGERSVELSATATAALAGLARRALVTLNTVMQGAWAALLGRYAAEREVVFGAVSSGRPPSLPGVEAMIGLFINTLPIRVRLDGAAVEPWLRELQNEQAEARQYEYSPLVDIHRWSGLPAAQPLFETLVAFENYPLDTAGLQPAALRIERVAFAEATNYPLTLMTRARQRLPLKLIFDRHRFDDADAARLLHHLGNLLAAMAADETGGPFELPLLAVAERHQLLVEWNDTAVETCAAAEASLIHQLFERQADAHPAAPAVISAAGTLTYEEVERQANRIAHLLRRRGVAAGDLVAVYLGRGPAMVTALLGILKAGAAYVPLADSFPPARLQWILDTLRVSSVLTDGSRLAILQPLQEAGAAVPRLPRRLVSLEACPELAHCSAARPLPAGPAGAGGPSAGGALAYVIFTSGSTGTPKGVTVQHRPVVNLIRWVNDTFAVGPGDRMLFLTPLTFDLSVYDVFGILAAGGAVRVATGDEVQEPQRLVELLDQGDITFWDSAPAALQQLIPFLPSAPQARAALRLVFLSGDWVPLGLPDEIRRAYPAARVVALGGATEATIWSNYHQVEEIDPAWVSVPYGRPIRRARYHVLDGELRPAPIGAPGDLFIAGECLFAFYAGDPVLTAVKLVPDPFGTSPGGRMYRTGDRARYHPDGKLEFLGRLDQQVKIRGFRIELGEIEAALAEHPEIRDAAVVVRTEEDGRPRLAAFLLARATEAGRLTPEEVRRYLEQRLPAYMVPSAIVVVDALPVTPNGKVDRKALAALPLAAPAAGGEPPPAAPRDAVERRLAEIWCGLLRLPAVGIHDNFFALGGDSILSIQIVARAARLGIRLSPRQLFEHPTIAELAAVVGCEVAAAGEQGRLAGAVPLAPPQHWFVAQELAEPGHFNQAVLLRSGERLAARCLAQAVSAVIDHHDALRLRFTPGIAGWSQVYAEVSGPPAFCHGDLAALPQPRLAAALTAFAARLQASLDLTRGPVFRAALLDCGEAGSRLLLVAHHLVIDGVSWRVLLEDLEQAYRQVLQGGRAVLPAKTTSYRQWSQGLARIMAAGGFGSELPYWLALAAAVPAPPPLDFAGGTNRAADASSVIEWLAPEHTAVLLAEGPHRYRCEVETVLLAALVEALGPWTGERRLLLELERHGREPVIPATDLSRTVGWFTAFVPVLLDLRAAEGVDADLKAVKERLRTIPSHGVGFGALRYLAADAAVADSGAGAAAELRRISPQLGFNYLGQLDRALDRGSWFEPASEPAGPPRHAQQRRRHLLEIGCSVVGGSLRTAWTFSRAVHRPETVARLAASFLAALHRVVDFWRSTGRAAYTPSDFPLAALDQAAIDRLLPDAGVEAVYPLSPTQQGMLFFHLYAPRSDAYFQQLSCGLRGELDPRHFRDAWQAVFLRHDVLRTGFVWEGLAEPLQVVRRTPGDFWRYEDWSGLAEDLWAAEVTRRQRADRERGFDLAGPSLARVTCIRLAPGLHYFIFSFHHLLMDGWSLQVLTREVLRFYDDLQAGRETRLEPAVQYRDFVAWLRRQDRAPMEAFWRRALDGFAAATRLPGDLRPGSLPDPRILTSGRRLALAEPEADALRSRARRHQLTLNTLVQGAWALLLARYGAADDVLYGATVAGRPPELPGVEAMVGLFINTLPVRVKGFSGPADRWLARLQDQQAEMRQYEWSALSELSAWSQVSSGTPLFDSILVFENYPVDAAVSQWQGEISVGDAHAFERTSYALTLVVIPRHHLALNLGFDRGRFDGATASRLLSGLRQLLLAMSAGLERPVRDLDLLSAAEAHQMLREWNDTAVRQGGGRLVHEQIAARAAGAPDALAVVSGGEDLTYGELASRVRALAARLGAAGVGPERRVALLLPRSPELIVALLAVLEAGGAYVPLDPALPPARLASLLADCGAMLLLSQPELAGELTAAAPAVLWVGPGGASGDGGPALPPTRRQADPLNAAYVIYTSGSTGRPKGVVVPHAALAAYAECALRRDEIGPGDRVLQFASISFDASAEEIFPCLLGGATLVLRPPEMLSSSRAFLAAAASLDVSVLDLPTAWWHTLVSDLAGEQPPLPPCLRLVIIGGEAAHIGAVEAWAAWAGGELRLLNTYGPTETTIVATDCLLAVGGRLRIEGTDVPIGTPVAGVQVYLLDEEMRPAPLGAVGEVYIGGAGVARGYSGLAAQTAERFLPDPFAAAPGARLYRSGDLARLRPDGRLVLIGRADRQVKIRGFRVEPGEVEAALAALPAVRRAAVVAHERPGIGLQLVACLEGTGGGAAATEEARASLRRQLPDYMVPAAFVSFDELPTTPSGKVDRRRLSAALAAGASAAGTGEGTVGEAGGGVRRGAAEELLAAIWSEVLGIERISDDDSFFDL